MRVLRHYHHVKRFIFAPFNRLRASATLAIFGVDDSFKHFDTQKTFEKIYRQKIWGRDAAGKPLSGAGSHDAKIVDPYVTAVKEVLASAQGDLTLVDLGCGDFNVGSHFVRDAKQIIACDISNVILENNQKGYNFSNVIFRHLNIISDELPKGDIACLRQVLQHLSNESIAEFVTRLNKTKPYDNLIVTEHLPAGNDFEANINKPTGPGTRVPLKSGVDLSLPPFNLEFVNKRVLLEIDERFYGADAVIRTTLYSF